MAINLDEYPDIGTHWIALFCNRKEIVSFDSFCDEHVPGEIKEFVRNKNIIANMFRVQTNNSVMCGTSALDSLILLVCFLLMTLKRMTI